MKIPSVNRSGQPATARIAGFKHGPATHAPAKPGGASPAAAAAELRDQIETWVEEGGAGDDVAP